MRFDGRPSRTVSCRSRGVSGKPARAVGARPAASAIATTIANPHFALPVPVARRQRGTTRTASALTAPAMVAPPGFPAARLDEAAADCKSLASFSAGSSGSGPLEPITLELLSM
ncbi:hypothetical protein GCM10027159_32010 [Lysobacter terrae]